MRSVAFDYPDTCPRINRAINAAREQISDFLDDLLYEACGLLPKEVRQNLVEQYTKDLYEKLEDAFEETRSTNVDMREEADSQIKVLKDQVSDLEHQLKQLESA
ncbi:hypothetical protein [uncultured Rhodoferax sp.]|uniref:hypothetical protein n=1 Tax=uncultured Rhodoferax sp. TaxID=223188 RepID=UPI0025FFE992|nr:hypothetical protein [uncultured Rhodoferax sp.]